MRGGGACSGGAAPAASAKVGLQRPQGHRRYSSVCWWLRSCSGLVFAVASRRRPTTLAVRQVWCCPCLRIRAASTHPARLQGLAPRRSTAAARHSSQGPERRHTRHAGSLTLLKHWGARNGQDHPTWGRVCGGKLGRQCSVPSAAAAAAASAALAKKQGWTFFFC